MARIPKTAACPAKGGKVHNRKRGHKCPFALPGFVREAGRD
jgi:hypothetical protein